MDRIRELVPDSYNYKAETMMSETAMHVYLIFLA